MPEPKLIHTYAYFQRYAAGTVDRDNKPTMSSSDGIGTVTSLEYRNEPEFEVFDKPVNGKWVDYDIKANRDRTTFTIELTELSELFWELLRQTSVTLSGGGATYTPGDTLVTKGWLKLQAFDEDGSALDVVDLYCHVNIDAHTFAKTGLVTARISGRKLWSTLNVGQLSNIV